MKNIERVKLLKVSNYRDFRAAMLKLDSPKPNFTYNAKMYYLLGLLQYRHEKIERIIEEYVSIEEVDIVAGKSFDLENVRNTLLDRRYSAFLLETNLYQRILSLEDKSSFEICLRIYFSILDFQEFLKEESKN